MKKRIIPAALLSLAIGTGVCGVVLTACGDDDSKYFDEKTVFHVDLSMSTAIGPLGTLCNPGTLTFGTDGSAKMNITFTDSAKVMMDNLLGFRIGEFVHDDSYELNEDKTGMTYHSTRKNSETGELTFGDLDIEIEYLADDSMKFIFDIGAAIPDTVLYFYSNEDMMPEWNPGGGEEDPKPEEPKTFDVMYSVGEDVTLEEGFALPEKATYEEPTEITLPEAKFSKDKNIFRGWAINGKPYVHGEENIYQPGEKITVDYNAEIVAVWSDSVKFTFTKGSEAKDSSSYFTSDIVLYCNVGGYIYAPENAYIYDGYNKGFVGWREVGSESSDVWKVAKYLKVTEDMDGRVYEPVWAEIVDVKFYLNSASDTNYFVVKAPLGSNFKLPDASVVGADSKIFAGWQQNGEGTAKKPTDSSADVTKELYYVASVNTAYTLTFDANGSEGTAPANMVVGMSMYFFFPECNLTREGYVFNGWGTSKTASSGSMPGVRSNGVKKDTIYYAVWCAERTVSFDTGVSGQTIPSVKQGEGMKITLPEIPCENGKSVFDGWSDGSKIYQPGVNYTVPKSQDTQLTAVWRAPVTVTFAGGEGATGSVESVETYQSREIVLPENSYVASGKLFGGWTDGTNNYKPGDKYTVAADAAATLTINAIWNEGTPFADYTVVFRAGQSSEEVYKDADGKSVTFNSFIQKGSMTELVLRPDLTADFVVKGVVTEKDFNNLVAAGNLKFTMEQYTENFSIDYKNISYDYDSEANKVTLNLGGGETMVLQLKKVAKNEKIGYDNIQFEYTLKHALGAVTKLTFAAIDGEPKYFEKEMTFEGKLPDNAPMVGGATATLTVNTDGTGKLKVSFFSMSFNHILTPDGKTVLWMGDEGDRLEGIVKTEDGKMTLTVTIMGASITLTEKA